MFSASRGHEFTQGVKRCLCSENGYFLHDEMLKPTEALDPMNNKCTISSLYWHLGPLLGDDDDDDDDGLRSFPPSPANLENF